MNPETMVPGHPLPETQAGSAGMQAGNAGSSVPNGPVTPLHFSTMPPAEVSSAGPTVMSHTRAQQPAAGGEETTALTATSSAPVGSAAAASVPVVHVSSATLATSSPGALLGSNGVQMASSELHTKTGAIKDCVKALDATLAKTAELAIHRATAGAMASVGSAAATALTGATLGAGSPRSEVPVMTAEQVEVLRRQICVYSIISQQLVAMYQAMTTQHMQLSGVLGHSQYPYEHSAAAAAAAAAVAAAAAAGIPTPGMGSLTGPLSGTHTKSRQRWTPQPAQLQILEEYFRISAGTPNKGKIKEITQELMKHGQISETNVYNWFQNRKARAKRKSNPNGTNGTEKEADGDKTDGEDGDGDENGSHHHTQPGDKERDKEKRSRLEAELGEDSDQDKAGAGAADGVHAPKKPGPEENLQAGGLKDQGTGRRVKQKPGAAETPNEQQQPHGEGQQQQQLSHDQPPQQHMQDNQLADHSVMLPSTTLQDSGQDIPPPMDGQTAADGVISVQDHVQLTSSGLGAAASITEGMAVVGLEASPAQQLAANNTTGQLQEASLFQPGQGQTGLEIDQPSQAVHQDIPVAASHESTQHHSSGVDGTQSHRVDSQGHHISPADSLAPGLEPMPAVESGNPPDTNMYSEQGGQEEGNGSAEAPQQEATVQVLINGKPWDVPVTLLDVRNSFGASAVLRDAAGCVVPTNEHGITLAPLQEGASYTVEGADMAVVGDPTALMPDSILVPDAALINTTLQQSS